jgi:alpha-methylacyl-CoA racemase
MTDLYPFQIKVPFASLILADHGASVLRIDRAHPLAHTTTAPPPTADLLSRHKSSIALDLKSPHALNLLKDLLLHVDILLDPFRPGVLESLGLDPHDLLARNKRLIIARLTGFRRDGKYSAMAGHDINYLAVSGVLSQLGRQSEAPHPPANVLADFGGGGLTCALGIIMAVLVRQKTGMGQIVETSMVDGAAYLSILPRLGLKTPLWDRPRGENLLDGGCPYYDTYKCKDGGYMAIGALEPQFFSKLLNGLGLKSDLSSTREDRKNWPLLKDLFTRKFLEKTRTEWEAIFDGTDACCTPVIMQQELEAEGYEQRHAVQLKMTPGAAIDQTEAWRSGGLPPGTNGEGLLKDWMNWKRDRDYTVKGGGLVKIESPRL